MIWIKMDVDLFVCHWAGYFLTCQRLDDGWYWIAKDSLSNARDSGKEDLLEIAKAYAGQACEDWLAGGKQ